MKLLLELSVDYFNVETSTSHFVRSNSHRRTAFPATKKSEYPVKDPPLTSSRLPPLDRFTAPSIEPSAAGTPCSIAASCDA